MIERISVIILIIQSIEGSIHLSGHLHNFHSYLDTCRARGELALPPKNVEQRIASCLNYTLDFKTFEPRMICSHLKEADECLEEIKAVISPCQISGDYSDIYPLIDLIHNSVDPLCGNDDVMSDLIKMNSFECFMHSYKSIAESCKVVVSRNMMQSKNSIEETSPCKQDELLFKCIWENMKDEFCSKELKSSLVQLYTRVQSSTCSCITCDNIMRSGASFYFTTSFYSPALFIISSKLLQYHL